jgi:arylsulfatase A-like enzyme
VPLLGPTLYVTLSMVIQAQDYFLYLHRPADGWASAARFLGTLPFHQLQHLAAAALLALAGWASSGTRTGRVAHVLLVSLVALYAVVDQIAFQAFFGHFDLSLIDGAALDLGAARDSILAEVPVTFGPNLLVWLAMTVAMALSLRHPRTRRAGLALGPTARGAIAVYLAASVAGSARGGNYNLEQEPLAVLARSAFSQSVELSALPIPEADLYAPRAGATSSDHDRRRLSAMFGRLRESRPRPNIVMVMTESVGARQLFPGGRLSATVTPTLASLAGETVAFEALYNTFPASMRGHLPINTGGRTVTWSHFSGPVASSYRGPTLVGQLARLGYRSALVSAGEFRTESIDKFYGPLGYDYLYEPALETPAFVKEHEVHSWGISEDVARQRAVSWIDAQPRSSPFFLQLLTISTHHPYAAPASHRGPLAGEEAESRYYNALHYVDAVIGRLLGDLDARGLLDDTLVVLCGDHGQAFGTTHRGNFFHQGYLFEENVRNYMMVIAPGARGVGLVSSRVGSIGDIMPTILALAGGDPGDVRGQDLFSATYTERMAFFHKSVSPSQWGLRDGRWKFTSPLTSTREAELYDLSADPDEQSNVAAAHQDLVTTYQRAARQWYVQTNQDYVARVAGYVEEAGLSARDLLRPGPKRVVFGSRGPDGAFATLDAVHPEEDLVARVRWVPSSDDRRLIYRWISPGGRQSVFSVLQRGSWGDTLVHSEIIEPMEEGTWTLSIAAGERELLSGTFEVRKDAALRTRMDPSAKEPRAPEGRR